MATWNIDSAHSEVGFKIKHLMVSTAKGKFGTFSGSLTAADDMLTDAKISFEADVASIHTGNAQREGHLQSPDFFDAAKFPKMMFVSKSFTKKEGNEYTVVGDFTLKGVTKEVTLHATFNGISKSPQDGKRVAGFDVTGKIDRKDYGIAWNANLETGGVMLGEEVALDASIELKEA